MEYWCRAAGVKIMCKTSKKRLVQLNLMAAAALVLAMQSQSQASEFEGRIQALRLNTGSSPARVSILVGPHESPCLGAGGEWFAFENADQGLGSLWASALNNALVNRRTVFIAGNDQCDTFDIEGVTGIDFI
jgi:hypothetical protein